jgi:hypothetical protein
MNGLKLSLARAWAHFDPKMKYQLLSGLLAYAILKLGIQIDPVLEGFIALAIGGAVGYAVPDGKPVKAVPVPARRVR